MKKSAKALFFLVIAGGIAGCWWFGRTLFFKPARATPFKTQRAVPRIIIREVNAEGVLEAQGTSKIGPLITASVRKIHVKEGEAVEKGQILAELDNGFGGDAVVRQSEAKLEQTQAQLQYLIHNYTRQKHLYQSGQLAKDAFEKIESAYQALHAEVRQNQAAYDRERAQFEQTKVVAPHDGTVLSVNVKEGEPVSPAATPGASILFEIARNLRTMKAQLNVDESKIGDVVQGQKITLTVDTFPYKRWKSTVGLIGYAPVYQLAQGGQKPVPQYKVEALVENKELLLRTGMSVHAKILIGKEKEALALPSMVFQFSPTAIEPVAKVVGYAVKALDPREKKKVLKQQSVHPVKVLWVVKNNTFEERAVEIGLNDVSHYQIISGITSSDDVICDVEDMADNKAFMKTMVGGGL